uniref:Uncharacterized protein n=1 Tax=Arundo donax TaxID=35708 RepID=A0A0A8ZQS3_ARUDO
MFVCLIALDDVSCNFMISEF